MLDSVIRVNKKSYPLKHFQKSVRLKNTKIENLINDDLDSSSLDEPDNEPDSESDNKSDNDESNE